MKEEYSKFVDELTADEQANIVKDGFWKKVRDNAGRVPFVRDAVACYYRMRDEKVPFGIRAAVVLPLAYFVIPIDALPDIVPLLGLTDDAAFFGSALVALRGWLTPEHYALADSALGQDGPDTSA